MSRPPQTPLPKGRLLAQAGACAGLPYRGRRPVPHPPPPPPTRAAAAAGPRPRTTAAGAVGLRQQCAKKQREPNPRLADRSGAPEAWEAGLLVGALPRTRRFTRPPGAAPHPTASAQQGPSPSYALQAAGLPHCRQRWLELLRLPATATYVPYPARWTWALPTPS